jgi:hypothetical protein
MTPDQGVSPGGEGPKRYEQYPGYFFEATRFKDEQDSRIGYGLAQEAILRAKGCNISVFRFILPEDGSWHVALVSEAPDISMVPILRQHMALGRRVDVADNVRAALIERRIASQALGTWVEGHYDPGLPVRRDEGPARPKEPRQTERKMQSTRRERGHRHRGGRRGRHKGK